MRGRDGKKRKTQHVSSPAEWDDWSLGRVVRGFSLRQSELGVLACKYLNEKLRLDFQWEVGLDPGVDASHYNSIARRLNTVRALMSDSEYSDATDRLAGAWRIMFADKRFYRQCDRCGCCEVDRRTGRPCPYCGTAQPMDMD